MLFGRRKRAPRWADGTEGGTLEPILLDYFTRDGSTLMMRLLSTSPQIAVGGDYPYEHKYFTYLHRWVGLLERQDWPRQAWNDQHLASVSQEESLPFMGPPTWARRDLMESARGEESIADHCFRMVWEEFSRRASARTRERHRDRSADVRYYAEKHLNTWEVNLDELPPLRVIALLRDPRDTYVSINSFRERRQRAGREGWPGMGQGIGESGEDWLFRHLQRQKDRLRWIRRALKTGTMPVFRYEDMVFDLPSQAARLEDWLGVSLDPTAVAADDRMRSRHVSSETPEASIGRWRTEMPPEIQMRFNDELGVELEALGFDAPGAEPSGAAAGVSGSPAGCMEPQPMDGPRER